MSEPTITARPSDLANAVYAAAAPLLEAIEHGTRRVGNGHHAAQEVVAAFEAYLAARPGLFRAKDA